MDLPAATIDQRLGFFRLVLGPFIAMIRDCVDHEVENFLMSLALNLPAHLHREWEEEMLGVYLDQIAACGSPIEKEALYEHYRLGVLYSFVSPIVWWRSGVPEPQWWSALTNSVSAARDLGLLR